MSQACQYPNPLVRDGVSQQQRQNEALSPDFVRVDERELADFLVFAHGLARQLIYHDEQNRPQGDWQDFFAHSTPVQVALIAKTDLAPLRETYETQLHHFLASRQPESLGKLLQGWLEMLEQMAHWHQRLQAYTPLKARIQGLVRTNFGQPVSQLAGLLALLEGKDPQAAAAKTRLQAFAAHFQLAFSPPPRPDAYPFQAIDATVRTRLDQGFQVLYQNYRQVVSSAPEYLLPALAARQDHQPHLALYLAFLQLLQGYRQDLNRLTQRHLDFLYQRVLRLPKKAAVPAQAHLLFQLAQFAEEHALEAGIHFVAGEDAGGTALFYRLPETTVITRAQVAQLKGLFLAKNAAQTALAGLHSSPVANSFDGQGDDFPKDQAVKAWLPFGDASRPAAELGWAMASRLFLLREHTRTLTFTFTFAQNLVLPPPLPSGDAFEGISLRLSGEESWIEAQVTSLKQGASAKVVELTAQLKPEAPPTTPYHAALPGASLPTNLPVARLGFQTQGRFRGRNLYDLFRAARLQQVKVNVVVDKVQQLVLQNDLSTLDPAKPFQPFGPLPKKGSNLYLGSEEVFSKPLKSLKISLTWEGTPEKPLAHGNDKNNWHYRGYYLAGENEPGGTSPYQTISAKLELLRNKEWKNEGIGKALTLFGAGNEGPNQVELVSGSPLPGQALPSPLQPYGLQSTGGFLRLTLDQDFLHQVFPAKFALQALALAKEEGKYANGAVYEDTADASQVIRYNGSNLPKVDKTHVPISLSEPYSPVLSALSLAYTAEETFDAGKVSLESAPAWFHLYPFEGYQRSLPGQDWLPRFQAEGTLYLGLQDLEPASALNLLFQVAEETADTELEQAGVRWHYWAENETWKLLEEHQVLLDETNGLIRSGVVKLEIPADTGLGCPQLDGSLRWLRVTVPERSRAICHIIGVHTQAVTVVYEEQENDPNYLATPMPPGTISELAVPQAELEAIEQPYAAFGGKTAEADAAYYVRVSERLRHKGRAVTIFDYERLVLENFPEIYKVRCLNHTDDQRELMPGYVTLAVIPSFSQRARANELEPKVNINLLKEIEAYVRSLASPWASIKVLNPAYEAISTEFQVQFNQANFSYYRRELERGIVAFLSPWTLDQAAELQFGGKVFRSSILNFIEQQPYVDHVLNFQMHRGSERNLREIAASSARSILVSVPFSGDNTGHRILEATPCPEQPRLEQEVLGYEPLDQLELEE